MDQLATENIVLSYSNNFTATSSNNTSIRVARRNVMVHLRNSSLPASYFSRVQNSSSSSPSPPSNQNHRRVYSVKDNNSKFKSIEHSSIKSQDNQETFYTKPLINVNSNNNDVEPSSSSSLSSNQTAEFIKSSNVYNSTSPSSSPSIRSVHQFKHIHKKRLSRTIQHISSFLQIIANISSSISFPVTVEKTYTVERLARQIEAEYAFKYGGIEHNGLYEPLEVGLLYDVSMVALRFRDLVGDVLEHGDVVNVLNVYEGYNHKTIIALEDVESIEGDKDVESVKDVEGVEGVEDVEDAEDEEDCDFKSFGYIFENISLLSSDLSLKSRSRESKRFNLPISQNNQTENIVDESINDNDSNDNDNDDIDVEKNVNDDNNNINNLPLQSSTPSRPLQNSHHLPSLPMFSTTELTTNDTSDSSAAMSHNSLNYTQGSEALFQAVLSNTLAIKYFQKFAIREFSVENLLFWLDVELFAAGISCEIEDNYFEEQQTAVIYAKYIYLTYISPNAPLQVNLSDEIRRDIPWPIDDDSDVERNIFDEAQEAVYQLMKGHTFVRYENSSEWKECEKIKMQEPERYQNHEMTAKLENYFRPSMSLMLAVTTTLDNGSDQPPMSHHYKEQTLHSILSQYFPDTVLLDNTGKRAEQEYSQSVTDDSISTISGYFDLENIMTNAQKMRRIKKEKKLKWLFGEKVKKMEDQVVVLPDGNLYGDGKLSFGDDDKRSVYSTISENKKLTKEAWNRKKKVDKLEAIFGKGLRDSQLYSQNLIKDKGNSRTALTELSKINTNIHNNHHYGNDDNDDGANLFINNNSDDNFNLQTTNELSTKDRRILLKKNRKLQIMLGEALDENTVKHALKLPLIQSTPSTSPCQERYFEADRLSVNYQYDGRNRISNAGSYIKQRISRRASDSMITSTTPNTNNNDKDNNCNNPKVTMATSPKSPLIPSHENKNYRTSTIDNDLNDPLNRFNIPLIVIDKDTKEYRRKKLQKLHQFLGERVPIDIVLGEKDSSIYLPPQAGELKLAVKPKSKKHRPPPLSSYKKNSLNGDYSHKDQQPQQQQQEQQLNSNNNNIATKLSPLDKKRHLQRAVKLEKLFGEIPPQDLLLTTSSQSRSKHDSISSLDIHRKSIMSLEYLMENDRETIYDLIDYMSDNEKENQRDSLEIEDYDLNIISSSAPATPLEASLTMDFDLLSSKESTQSHQHLKHKQLRLRGIRKLSHFFGATYGQMFPEQVLSELLGELEGEIREEAKKDEVDKELIAGLMEQIEELRTRSSELADSDVETRRGLCY